MRISSFAYHFLAFVPSLSLAQATTALVEYYPFEIVCSGQTVLSTSTTTRLIPGNSTGTFFSPTSSPTSGIYTTDIVTANVTTPIFKTGMATCATCPTPVTEFVPPNFARYGIYTTTQTANVTTPVFITGTPTCATCSTPVTELVPPNSSGTGAIPSKSSSSTSMSSSSSMSPSSSPTRSSMSSSSSMSPSSSPTSSSMSSSSSMSPSSSPTSSSMSSSSSNSPSSSPTASLTTSSSSSSSSSSTSSSTPTPSNACAIRQCAPGALTVKGYYNSYVLADAYAAKDGHSGVGPDYYLDQNLQPLNTGTTTNMSVPATYGSGNETYVDGGDDNQIPYYADTTAMYGGFEYNPNNFTFVWTGYFVPQQSGSYQFCLDYADNEQAFYIGSDTAFPCGDSSNAATPRNAQAYERYWFASSDYNQAVCKNMTLTAGFYYPIRAVYGTMDFQHLLSSSQFRWRLGRESAILANIPGIVMVHLHTLRNKRDFVLWD
ncbi:hypothetical protein KCU81_g9464, partial [Aureobasidium melanogenum]|uniref:PA14 domain-containing protein n=1 Tax=Aureobasidium melanogenum (strain CBS 110374) TaxID=1043003 RepID=A0A074WDA2_AURM1